ncbi:GH116 family glycosyl-hydrolase [Pelagicoccus sp. SDUM812005]|uniref:GH116 family glycosyl-hydrolase n=1 Tax=Pelagicoccus sp. SDUM812005 TaxID=3041257 RepID=UPI00280DE5C5|nr:GH116 family glycosyl-hydrolase [Pelagicoccus sp. SDUM812005]MDQ8180265.1 GH116 family glycosyl-hydrolase [Pelagicoccus sp. SDUM812005]
MIFKKVSENQIQGVAPAASSTVSRRRFLVSAGAFAAGLSLGPLGGSLFAAGRREEYAKALKSHDSLRGYWKFDGDLLDALSNKAATAAAPVSFVDGAVEGDALSLTPQQSIFVKEAEHLRGRSATLELFFKVDSRPEGDDDLVLIAQTAGREARYVVGIKNDLSALLYRNVNAAVLTEVNLPTAQPIELGRWYHLAVTSFDLDVRAYVDGYECSLVGGAYEFTRRGPKKTALNWGGIEIEGWSSGKVCLDEVACYAEGLTQAQIQKHIRAAGWGEKLEETGALVASVLAEREARRARKAEAILANPELTDPGRTQVYEGERLTAINFIVGGIGAGGIQFNGKAEPAIWQIACNYEEHRVEDSFLAVRAQAAGGKPVVRALQTEPVGAFQAMSSLKFEGEYPFAKYRFEESELPVEVELEVFNPFIPMDLKSCAIPCAIYTVKATNRSSRKATVDVLAAQKNALGFDEGKGGRFGRNQNAVVKKGDATFLHMTRDGVDDSDMVLMSQASGVSSVAEWDSLSELHDRFAAKGKLQGPPQSKLSPSGRSVNGALAAPLELAAGETKSVTFALAWYFKDGEHGQGKRGPALEGEGRAKPGKWLRYGQNYTNWWPSALGVAEDLQKNLASLTARTRRFHDTFYASKLPVWLLDRMSSQLAVLRSQTCWWSEDGYFGAWEGCNADAGCCGGNCTHVWHYAQGHARLLPELGRKMREQDYSMQLENGLTPYRHTNTAGAADGFYGTILNTYREHLCSPDSGWLKSLWPKVKKGMDWSIDYWNPSRDGFMETVQHNTLDGDIMGCSSWIGSLYLSALEAAARMADLMGEPDAAAEYRRIRESGKKLQNESLWNGEYYIQEVGEKRIQDYLDGCHIDQILGEWWADQIDIDRNFPPERSRRAMESLLKYNFRADFHGQSLKPRQYCEVDDGGMKMITWPKDPQPIPGMKYGDEVMTGFEYGAAVSMIQNGMLKEGLMVIKIISDRYDGRLRTEGVSNVRNGPWGYSGNPFGDDECGKFYGRSLSVWSALLALQGFSYDGPAGRIGFRPVLNPEDHASFFTAAEGYGLFSQKVDRKKLTASLELSEGTLRLSEIALASLGASPAKSAEVTLAGKTVKARLEAGKAELRLIFQTPIVLEGGARLSIEVS